VKLSRLFVLLVLVGFTASAALADGIDPTVVIRQVDPPPVAITNPSGTIGVFVAGTTAPTVAFAFQNDTGVVLTSISVTLFGLSEPLDFSLGDNPGDGIFKDAWSVVNPNGTTTLFFANVDESHTGLLPAVCNIGGIEVLASSYCQQCIGGIYSFEFTGIPLGDIVVGAATVSAPEPGTLMLLSAGLVGLLGLRKRKAALQS